MPVWAAPAADGRSDLPGLRRHAAPLALLGALVLGWYAPQLAIGALQFDAVEVHYSSQRYLSEAIHAGRLPFWTPYLFGGFPFLADLQVGAWYPFNWPFLVLGITPRSIIGELVVHGLIACAGAYALSLRLTGQPAAAVLAGVMYGLSGYVAAHSQHVGIVETTAWFPWLVLLLDTLAERLSLRRLALAGLLGAMLALPGHFQTALYAASGAAVWGLLEAGWQRSAARLRRTAAGLLASAGWGGLLAAVMVLPAAELVRQSLRSQFNARSTDLGYFQLDALLTLVQPDHYGLLSGAYRGPGDVTQHFFYAGILLVPLAVLGLLARTRVTRTALLLGLPFVWYAAGPAGGLFRVVSRLPGFSSVELPMHGWFLPALGLALLAAAGLGWLQARVDWRGLGWLVVLITFADVLVFTQLLNPLAFARQALPEIFVAPGRSWRTELDAARPAVQRLYGPPLAAIGYRNHALQDHVETTYGYNPLELLGYSEYADAAERNPRLQDGLAATHQLVDGRLQPLATALPLVFFARQLTPETDAAAVRAALPELDPAEHTLLVDPASAATAAAAQLSGPPLTVAALAGLRFDPAASVEVVERGGDQLVLRSSAATSNLLRVAIPAYPGWHATLEDGSDLPVLTVDQAFIGIVVPPGPGIVIRLAFTPRLFGPAAALSGVAGLAVVAALRFGFRRS